MAYDAAGIPNFSSSYLVRTTTDFASYSEDVISVRPYGHRIGFVHADGAWRLGDVYMTRSNGIRFRREV